MTGVHMKTRTQKQQEETSPSYRQAKTLIAKLVFLILLVVVMALHVFRVNISKSIAAEDLSCGTHQLEKLWIFQLRVHGLLLTRLYWALAMIHKVTTIRLPGL
jgi:hypothetical protein